ncbi:TRI27 protein, partial [Hemiprocne comata]|nr:TRI27 protein [Hemiprocne comata]
PRRGARMEDLHREASCSICLSFFQDPVSIHCGHNFCRGCISRCWEGLDLFSCPQCRQVSRQQNFRPSRELANLAKIAQKMNGGGGGRWRWDNLCRHHLEVLKFFCKEEQVLLCRACGTGRDHRPHRVVPVEEAAQECQENLQSRLRVAKEQRQKFLESRKSHVWKSSHLEKTRSEARKIVCEFEQFHQFLKDQEHLLLTQLADLDRAITKLQEEAVTKVLEEMSHLDTFIWEMEGKFQQPASQFLQVRTCCEMMKFNPPEEISPQLERKLEDLLQKNVLVRRTLRRCQGKVWRRPPNVTLDPTTAHPNLHLSQDLKEAKGQLTQQDLQDNPTRFDFEPCVLGLQSFTSGRHFWEVDVGQGGVWALGVARESVKRKGPISFSPKEGVWALEAYHNLTSPRANQGLHPLPRRIKVSLDYEGGRVAFFSPDEDVPILVFTEATFNGEKVFPWFKVGLGARLQEVTQWSSSEEGQVVSPLDWVGFRCPLRICP